MAKLILQRSRLGAISALTLAFATVTACVTADDRLAGRAGQGAAAQNEDVTACLKAETFYATQQRCGPNSRFASKAAMQAGREKYEDYFRDPSPDVRLIRAVIAMEHEKAKASIKDGANVNRVHSGEDVGLAFPALPIDQAASNLDLNMVHLLLDAGANPNTQRKPSEPSLLVGNILTQIATTMPHKELNQKRKQDGLKILEAVLKAGYKVTVFDLEAAQNLGQRKWGPPHEPNDRYLLEAYRLVLTSTPPTIHEQLAARKAAFETADRKRDEDYAATVQRKQQEQASARDAQVRSVSRVGQKVCQTAMFTGDGRSLKATVIGYTERETDGRVQIRMRGTDPYIPGVLIFKDAPLQPDQLIWDDPINWNAC